MPADIAKQDATFHPNKNNPPRKGELTIQEMAQQSGLSEHTLRYYERVGLLTAITRHSSSGHRRYSAEDVGLIETLACLRGTGLSIADMHHYLRLRARGVEAAAEQRALFAAHEVVVKEELERLKLRLAYLAGKVAFWEAVEAGDMETARAIGEANSAIAKKLTKEQEHA